MYSSVVTSSSGSRPGNSGHDPGSSDFFELFIHQFLNFCSEQEVGVLVIDRKTEFAPVKNAEGVDSPESARQLIYQEAREWLERVGFEIEEGEDDPEGSVEVDFLTSYKGEELDTLNIDKKLITPIYIR